MFAGDGNQNNQAEMKQLQAQQSQMVVLDSCKQLLEAHSANGELKLENARLQQKLTDVKEHVLGLEWRLSDLKVQNGKQPEKSVVQDAMTRN